MKWLHFILFSWNKWAENRITKINWIWPYLGLNLCGVVWFSGLTKPNGLLCSPTLNLGTTLCKLLYSSYDLCFEFFLTVILFCSCAHLTALRRDSIGKFFYLQFNVLYFLFSSINNHHQNFITSIWGGLHIITSNTFYLL